MDYLPNIRESNQNERGVSESHGRFWSEHRLCNARGAGMMDMTTPDKRAILITAHKVLGVH